MTSACAAPNPIRSVVLVNDYLSLGGAEGVVVDTAALLESADIHVHVFTSDDVPRSKRTIVSYLHNRAAQRSLTRLLDEVRPDVVHFHNVYHELSPAVLSVPAGLGIASVFTAHDWHLVCPNPSACRFEDGEMRPVDVRSLGWRDLLTQRWDPSRVHSLARLLQHIVNYRFRDRRTDVDLVVCPSANQADVFRSAGIRAAILHNAQPDDAPAGHTEGRAGFVFAGRVEPEKGLAEFIAAAPLELLNQLTVLGEGADLERCQAAAADRGATVDFAGRVSREATLDVFAKKAVLVMPSRWPEIAPLAVIEALAGGCRVLGSRLGGLPELCVGHDDLLFDPFSADDIRRACERALAPAPDAAHVAPRPVQTRAIYLAELLALYGDVVSDDSVRRS